MGQLVVANYQSIKGPWLVDSKSLHELIPVLDKVNTCLEKANNEAIQREADDLFARQSDSSSIKSIEDATAKIRTQYSFQIQESKVVLSAHNSKELKDFSLSQLLKDPQLDTFNADRLLIETRCGTSSFSLELDERIEGRLYVRISTDNDSVANEISYEVNRWIDANSVNTAIRIWSQYIGGAARALLIACIFLVITLFAIISTTASTNYSDILRKEAKQLLSRGINTENSNKALELLLKLQTDYAPADYATQPTSLGGSAKYLFIDLHFVWILLALIILSIAPKTTIGIGQRKRLYSFYKFWTYIVLITIPNILIWPWLKSKIPK